MTKSADFAIVVRSPGGPETLEWTELETTAPARGEVLIAQRAVGVNFIDTYYRKGHYPWPVTPLIPGGEAAGVVEEVGEGVTEFKSGDRVAYILPIGAYRTRRVVAAERLVKLPEGIEFEVAASMMLKGLTTQFLLNSCYAVKASDTVLVHAAAGGVGQLMGQWLKLIGATAIGTVGSAEKISIAHRHLIRVGKTDPDWAWLILRFDVPYRAAWATLGQAAAEDLEEGLAAGRFEVSNAAVALTASGGALFAVIHEQLIGGGSPDADSAHAEGVLRSFGLAAAEAAEIARRELPPLATEAS